MDTQSKFCQADAVDSVPLVISPHVDDRSGPDSGRTQIMSSGLMPLGVGAGGVADEVLMIFEYTDNFIGIVGILIFIGLVFLCVPFSHKKNNKYGKYIP